MNTKLQVKTLPAMAEDVRRGLTSRPKSLPPRLFYDATGSALFERITELPEYYLTNAEREIFERFADEIADCAGPDVHVIELGAGSASKTQRLLRAIIQRQGATEFHPIDVSPTALEEARQSIEVNLPDVRVIPEVLDYSYGIPFAAKLPGTKLVLYIGSSIGNFEPLEASSVLSHIRRALNPGDAMLIGTDMRKAEELLVPAYNDPQGVTAAFNRNILSHINQELDANFAPEMFQHIALWNEDESRMEIYLESSREQTAFIRTLDMKVHFAKGEKIHTENSYKFTMPMIESIAANGGFKLERTWNDSKRWFTVHLLRVP